MIVKVTRGARMSGLVYYLLGEGRHEEHTEQRVIAASVGIEVPLGRELSASEARDLVLQLNTPMALYGREIRRGHVWHLSMSNRDDDRPLSEEQWAEAVRHVMAKVGFDDADKAPAPWAAFHHGRSASGNDHVHVAVCLVREDGTEADTHGDYFRLSDAARELEERFGLVVVAGRHGQTATRWPGRAEWEITERQGGLEQPGPGHSDDPVSLPRMLVAREDLAVIVRGVAAASRDEAEFVRRLWDAGIETRARTAAGDTSQVAGYAVRPIDTERWWAGGKLAKDLSLPSLRRDWEPVTDQVAAWRRPQRDAGALRGRDVDDLSDEQRAGLEGREWEAVPNGQWELAARWARSATDDITSGAADHSSVADRAAGLAAALSARLEPTEQGPLRHLAHELSRYPHPRRTAPPRGETPRFRAALATAATVALQGTRTGQTAAVLALVIELVRLADTLAQLHETRQHLEYARALRRSTAPVAASLPTAHVSADSEPPGIDPGVPTPAAPTVSRLDPRTEARQQPQEQRGFER